ncbi:MAG: hypothetical protein H6869_08620 [Rhodospirillales bacterium]|nr:hypothetical protein [Rhodospirillales bacterium]
MDCDCKSVFNRLSRADRIKLRSAAISKAVTGFVKDDTAQKPWRYPFYAAYLLAVSTPLPVPLASTALLAATVVWAKYSKGETAARLNSRISEAFNNHAALVCRHKSFIAPDKEQPDKQTVKTGALAWDTTKKSLRDIGGATAHAWKALKKAISP